MFANILYVLLFVRELVSVWVLLSGLAASVGHSAFVLFHGTSFCESACVKLGDTLLFDAEDRS
eukprot:gene6889-7614_t